MRATIVGATLAAAGCLLPVSPAQAAGGFGAEQATCAQKVAAVADGTVYGVGDCAGGVSLLVRAPGQSWRDLGPAWPDKHVEAVAADDTATFVVMSCIRSDRGCAADPLGKDFFIGKVPHGGRPSALTSLGGTEQVNDTATVAARGGTWWAAYTSTVQDRDRAGSGSQTVYYRKTLGGVGQGQVPVPPDAGGARTFAFEPALGLTGAGAVVALVTQTDRGDATPTLQVATAGTDGRFSTAAFPAAAGAPATVPDVAVSGGRTFIAWSRAGRPALAFEQNGTTRRFDLPYRGTIGLGLSVTASGGLVTVSTAEQFDYQGKQTSRVYARTLDSNGVLRSTTELSAAAGRQDPFVQARLNDSTAARGRATVAYAIGARRASSSQ